MISPLSHSGIFALAMALTAQALPATLTQRQTTLDEFVGHVSPPAANPSAPVPTLIHLTPEDEAVVANWTTQSRTVDFASFESANAEKRGVIGADNRVLTTSTAYPYSAMGRIIRSDGIVCSGSLVGPRHVTTAKHCVPTNGASMQFQPAYNNGPVFPSAYAIGYLAGNSNSGASDDCARKEDWAVLLLSARLGDARGYLGFDTLDDAASLNRAIFSSYGYPTDIADGGRPYRQDQITVSNKNRCDAYGPLYTNADAAGGQSGSPLYLPPDAQGVRYQYGVMSQSSSQTTVFAGGNNWAGTISLMLQNYP